MNKNSVLVLILVLAVTGGWVYQFYTKPKTGYILIQEVYNDFDLKKEMEKKFLQTKNARQKVLDSLTLELKFLANKLDILKEKKAEDVLIFNNKRDGYLQKKELFEQDNTQMGSQYDQEILSQLNQYVKDYGIENHYTYIFGNDNNGSLMYAKDAENITKQVTEYINLKYNGK